MKLSRRSFMKANAVAAAAAAAGLSVPGVARAVVGQQEAIKWDKAPCRFCGTGCGVLVGTQQGRVVACQGDPDAPVNRGLNCIKGYFLPKIMYGKDRLTQPLLRMKNGKYDKEGEFTPITWDQAFDVMEEKFKTALKEKGPESIGMFGSGQWTIWEGYAASKLFKAGFRSNNIDPNARHCMASAVVGFMRTFGMDEPMGCYDDIEQADAFVLWGSNMAEMHPILWSRITNRRLSNQNVTVAVLSTYQHRRSFMKANAVAAAAAAAGLSVPGVARAVVGQQEAIKWDKAPCRFCGTGCGVLVGTQQGRVVACQGDPDAPVNRGLNCIKGYFLPKIMYGKDRLTQPLLRMKNCKYDKEGEITPITWDQAFDVMEEKFKTALKEKGPESIGMFGSGQWTIWEGYAASKLFKAGFRSNNIDPNARHCMASGVVGFMRTFGMDEPMGCYDDIAQADAFVLWGANMAEMHPILWSRITNRRLSNQNVTVAVLSTYQHRSFELADNGIIFTPQSDLVILNYIANYIIQNNAINQDFFSKHVNLRKGATDIGYGLRPTHPTDIGYGLRPTHPL